MEILPGAPRRWYSRAFFFSCSSTRAILPCLPLRSRLRRADQEARLEIARRQRLARAVALPFVAAQAAQHGELAVALDAFGNDVELEAARERDDGLHDRHVVRA